MHEPAPSLPRGWTRLVSADGKYYHQNEIDQTTEWEPTSESAPQLQQPPQTIATKQVQLTVGTNSNQGTSIGAVASNQMQYPQHGQQPPMPQRNVQSQQQVVIIGKNGQPQLQNIQHTTQEKAHYNIGLDAPKKRSCCVVCLEFVWRYLVPIIDVLVSIGTLITTIIVWAYAQSKDNVGGICCGLIYSGLPRDKLTDYADGCTWDNIAENGMIYTNITNGIQYCMTNEGVVCNQGTVLGPGKTKTTLEQCMIDGGYTIMDVCDPDDMNRRYKDDQSEFLPFFGLLTVVLVFFFLCASIADLFGRNSKADIKEVFYRGCCCHCYRYICCCMLCISPEAWEKGMKIYGWFVFKICCWVPPLTFARYVEGKFENGFYNTWGGTMDPGFFYATTICAGDGSTVYVDYSQSPLVQEGAWIMNINDRLGLYGLIRTSVGLAIGVILGCCCKQGFGDLELNEILDLL